jgi:hypothetical protein
MNGILKTLTILVGTTVLTMVEVAYNFNTTKLTTNFSINAPALADVAQGYVPPSGLSRPQRTDGGGSRGCNDQGEVTLNLLVPSDHTAQTVSEHPTFFWYVSSNKIKTIKFVLTDSAESSPLIVQQLKIEKAGIMQVTVPEQTVLQNGHEYRWTVSLICSASHPSENVYARAWMKKIPLSDEVSSKLKGAKNNLERAQVYATSSIWYDALSLSYSARNTNGQNNSTTDYFSSLLSGVGLGQVKDEITSTIK